MSTNPNPKGVILLDNQTEQLKAVVPDEIEAKVGELVEWVVLPSHLQVAVKFSSAAGSPFGWSNKTGRDREIKGTVETGAAPFIGSKSYKYTVLDEKGNTIDPHVRVRK